ncbi:MAG: RNA-binding transcriptional accessory protein [Ruminococcaceae bacterium]|nr:RNA-binding transcriptional accessory protein [Oscillospiraceae bacterium]
MNIINELAAEFKLRISQVEATVGLIDDGNTIPFIARYRKEVTGSLDDEILRNLDERLKYLRSLEQRKEEVRALIDAQGKLTPEIEEALANAKILTEVEDIYRPYKPKRETRGSLARKRGLEPLAQLIMEQRSSYERSIEDIAGDYITTEAEDKKMHVKSAEDAINGAKDIIAEDVSDNAEYRKAIRALTFDHGTIVSKKAKDEQSVYEAYYDYNESVKKIPGHRVLAINRGEKEEFLKVNVQVDSDIILNYLFGEIITNVKSPAREYLQSAIVDSYDRLIAPSVEREIRASIFDDASESAIKLFSDNLKHLLMQAPLRGKTVLGYDPGYRTGCKLAVVDKTGKYIDWDVIYPTKPREDIEGSTKKVERLIRKYGVDVVAIGNGTASKESEIFIAGVLKGMGDPDKKYIVVSEAGASVYSASKLGTEEFPDFDVTQRSAISIARRLQDPLAELVKIDPKSIGVGQYQHDMKQARLDEALGGVVEDCVNRIGVDVNTASYSLLSYISGINLASAKNIVKYREENGEFTKRSQLLKVPKIGDKAYQQCAGFLRVPESKEILDNTGVHPEAYDAAKALLAKFDYTMDDVAKSNLKELRQRCAKYGTKKLASELEIGEPTLLDIIGELEKPGRDVRDSLPQPILRADVLGMEDLREGMELVGTVRNVIDFGAFVDIGVHQDGLVHISEISTKYIKHPSEVLSVGDVVNVRIKSVDLAKKRIALTMKF